jgi:thioredoxin-related protein
MNVKLLIFLPVFFLSSPNWYHNLNEAEKIAQKEHKYILLNFSGSDWCGPCIRMHADFFESPVFKQMADTELVMVNADFPRKKKNQYTLLLNAHGKVLLTWEGLPEESPEAFTLEIRNAMYSNQP